MCLPKQFAIFDLDTHNILSYYKMKQREIRKYLKRDDYRKQIFGYQPIAKREVKMLYEDYTLEEALGVLEELYPIDAYEYAIEAIQKEEKQDECLYQDGCVSFRMNDLRILIDAEELSERELQRIKKVDRFILAAKWLPDTLMPLKEWLKDNHLP